MKAAILRETGKPLTIEDVSVDNVRHNEVLIDVAATGLCHTDLHFMEGHIPLRTPAILGHETAGVVRAVGGGVTYLKPGDHVIGCLSAFCGECEMCLSGRPSVCEGQLAIARGPDEPPRLSDARGPVTQFMHLSGFAEQMLVHEHALVKIDRAMPLDRAALIGCGVMTGYGAVTRTAGLRAGQSIAVIGCGAIGLNVVQSAALAGAMDIIAVDINSHRLKLAKILGATHVIQSGDVDTIEEVRALTGGKGVDCAFEAVGQPELAERAFLMTRKAGKTVLIGLMGLEERISFPFGHFIAERQVIGCDMGSNQFRTDMPRLVRFYMDGRLDLDSMLSARLPVERINDGFEAMKRGEGIRTIIDFQKV